MVLNVIPILASSSVITAKRITTDTIINIYKVIIRVKAEDASKIQCILI